jgi:hypothetical protein
MAMGCVELGGGYVAARAGCSWCVDFSVKP